MTLTEKSLLNPSLYSGLSSVIYRFVTLAAIAWLTKRLDIRYVTATASDNGNNMIGREFLILAATSATATILFAKPLKFFGRKTSSRLGFTGAATVFNSTNLIGVIFFPLAISFAVTLLVDTIPLAAVLALPFLVFLSPLTGILPLPFSVCPLPAAARLPVLFRVFLRSLRGSCIDALLTNPTIIPLTCPASLTRLPITFSHNTKRSFALVAKGAILYNPFAASALNTCRHVLELLIAVARTLLFHPLILPQFHAYSKEKGRLKCPGISYSLL